MFLVFLYMSEAGKLQINEKSVRGAQSTFTHSYEGGTVNWLFNEILLMTYNPAFATLTFDSKTGESNSHSISLLHCTAIFFLVLKQIHFLIYQLIL